MDDVVYDACERDLQYFKNQFVNFFNDCKENHLPIIGNYHYFTTCNQNCPYVDGNPCIKKNFKYFDKFRQYDELHHVLQGKNPGRTSNDERILCYNYGIALHDIVFASRIFEKTKSTQIGFDYKKESNKVWV